MASNEYDIDEEDLEMIIEDDDIDAEINNNKEEAPPLLKNRYPLVDFFRKMNNDLEEDAIFESELDHATKRHEIFGNQYTFTPTSDAMQYRILCPYDAPRGEIIKQDTDVFRLYQGNLQRFRLLAGDKAIVKGWVLFNDEENPETFSTFDTTSYTNFLQDLEQGENVLLTTPTKQLKGKIQRVEETHLDIIVGSKTRLKFDLEHIERNKFMIHPSDETNAISKKVFLTSNVIIKGDENALLTGDDLLGMLGSKTTYEAIHEEYPEIDNYVYNIASWKAIEDKKEQELETKTTTRKKAKSNNEWVKMYQHIYEQVDDEILIKSQQKQKTSKANSSSKAISKSSANSSSNNFPPGALVFHSVADSINASIEKYNAKARAFLILAIGHYYIEKTRRGEKYYNKLPIEYRIYQLEHQKLHDDRIIWIKRDDVTDQYKTPHSIVKDLAQPIGDLELYMKKQKTNYSVAIPMFKFKHAFKTYKAYQGGNGDQVENVIEFNDLAAQEVDTFANDDDDEDTNIKLSESNKFVSKLAQAVQVKLPLGQLEFIAHCFNDDNVLKNMIIAFALFAIFSQCHFPRLVMKNISSKDMMTSFPLGEFGQFVLIDHLAKIGIHIMKDRQDIKAPPKFEKMRNYIVEACKALLKQKPMLRTNLDSMKQKYTPQHMAPTLIPAWKPLVVGARTLKEMINIEKNTTQINISAITTAATTATTKTSTLNFAPIPKIVKHRINAVSQSNVLIIKPPQNMHVSPTLEVFLKDFIENNSYFEADEYFAPFKSISANDQIWNSLSTRITQMPGPSEIKDLIKDPRPIIDTILIEFIAYNVKDLLGKIKNSHLGGEDGFYHLEHIKKTKITREHARNVLKTHLNKLEIFEIAPYEKDLRYTLVYILLSILNTLDERLTTTYIVNELKKKLDINTTTVTTARESYEQIREARKKKLMDYYGKLDKDLRRLVKRAANNGLFDMDGAINNANGNNSEWSEQIAQSGRDDYDMNAEN